MLVNAKILGLHLKLQGIAPQGTKIFREVELRKGIEVLGYVYSAKKDTTSEF